MSLMGVDIGQGGVKAAVFGESGKLLAIAYQEYPTLLPKSGFCELDSNKVIYSALQVIKKVSAEVKKKDPVVAVGIASQGEAFTPVSKDGRFLGNAMTTADFRAQHLVAPWSRSFGAEKIYRITGHTPYHMYSLFKLLWLKEHQPDVWQKTWKFFFFLDLLAFVLTGETKAEYTMASRSMLFNVRTKKWSPEILDRIGLPGRRLPDVVPSGTVVGTLKKDIARKIGLDKKVSVVLGGHDQPCGALGSGAVTTDCASYSTGTAECICPAFNRLILNPELMRCNLATYPHVIPEAYTTVAFSLTGGNILRWVRDNLALEETKEARQKGQDPYEKIIKSADRNPSRLILLPHFCPTGTPLFDQSGTGVLFGLKLSTTRSEILRAFLEGITYEMKWNLSILNGVGLKIKELRTIGGGAKSATWLQIKADILGIPLTTLSITEATCMGAAILAGSGTGLFDLRTTAGKWAKPTRTFYPRPKYTQAYEERFEIYKEIYHSLASARQSLQKLKV
ncbi:MAG: FGGY-family carbohydrate kinase [Candidatus Omnitrophota bacterium]